MFGCGWVPGGPTAPNEKGPTGQLTDVLEKGQKTAGSLGSIRQTIDRHRTKYFSLSEIAPGYRSDLVSTSPHFVMCPGIDRHRTNAALDYPTYI